VDHFKLLGTNAYQQWNNQRGLLDHHEKVALDHLRAWWRGMCAAFPDNVIPEAMIPGEINDDPRRSFDNEQYQEFARFINDLSRRHDLPAPFRLDGPSGLLTSTQVAEELGVSLRRAQQLIGAHPDAQQIGRDWLLSASALEELRERPGRGWPKGKPRKTG
jgi:hypothetical protein